MSTKSPSFA